MLSKLSIAESPIVFFLGHTVYTNSDKGALHGET